MNEQLIREIDLMSFIAAITVTLIIANNTKYRLKHEKIEDKFVYDNINTWCLYFWLKAFSYILGIISRLYLMDYPITAFVIDLISAVAPMIGITAKIHYIERTLKIFKQNVFFYYNCFLMIVVSISWWFIRSSETLMLIIFILQIIGFAILPLLYLYMATKSEGQMKRNAIFVLIGLVLSELGISLQAHNLIVIFPNFVDGFLQIMGFPYQAVTPIIIIIGTLMIYSGYKDSF